MSHLATVARPTLNVRRNQGLEDFFAWMKGMKGIKQECGADLMIGP
jgi:hypothetical protein